MGVPKVLILTSYILYTIIVIPTGVAGAVLQTLIRCLTNYEIMTQCSPSDMCHMLLVTCHMSHVACL